MALNESEVMTTPVEESYSKLPAKQLPKLISKSKGALGFVYTLFYSKSVNGLSGRFFYILFRLLGLGLLYKTFSYISSLVGQRFISQAKLSVKSMLISNCKQESLTMHVNMCLNDTGPVPVTVVFDAPVRLGFNYNPLTLSPSLKKKITLVDGNSTDKTIPGIENVKKGVNYFGTANMPNLRLSPSVSNYLGVELELALEPDMFSTFSALLIESEELSLQMTGSITAFAFGILPIYNLRLDKSCPLKGMNGLRDLQVKSLNVTGGTPEYLELSIECNMYNPSSIDIDLGDVNLNMNYEGYYAGTVTIPSFKMSSGNNVLSALGKFQPDRQSPVGFRTCTNLLNTYLAGDPSSITIKGDHPDANQILYWKKALSCLTIPTRFSGIEDKILVQSSLVLSPLQLLSKVMGSSVPNRLKLFNPFDVAITVQQMEATATMRGTIIGRLLKGSLPRSIIMKPRVVTLSPQLDLSLEVGRAAIGSLFNSLATQELFFDCQSQITCLVGGYPITMDYSQSNVPLVLGS